VTTKPIASGAVERVLREISEGAVRAMRAREQLSQVAAGEPTPDGVVEYGRTLAKLDHELTEIRSVAAAALRELAP